MIQLTRLNRQGMVLNADLIKWVESSPDTVITLVTGEKLVVLESCEQVIAAVLRFRQLVSVEAAKRAPEGNRLDSADVTEDGCG